MMNNIMINMVSMSKKRVLVIDDDLMTLEFLETLLKKKGYEAICAIGADECMKKLKEVKPDIILLDIMMPKKSGWDVLEALKLNANTKNIPVIIITVKDDMKDISRANKYDNVCAYIVKPFENNDLIKKIEDVTTNNK